MTKLRVRYTIVVLSVLACIFMILPYICYLNTEVYIMGSCYVGGLRSVVRKQNVATSARNSVAVNELKRAKKYNFQLVMELEKREQFERRKDELIYKLERRREHVLDKTIDIDEPFPPISEEIAKVKRYYNISERKLIVLDSKFLIDSKMLCSEVPEMIVLVPSIPANENIRRAIRSTYGSIVYNTSPHLQNHGIERPIKFAFLLGRSTNQSVEGNIRHEQEKYGDIVQTDFTDSYYNLTFKILYGFKWADIFCKGVKYVLKADEDVFVNIKLLLRELKTYCVSEKGAVFGFIHSTSLGIRALRTGKWGVSDEEYPLRRYPPYAQGTSYTLTGNLIPKILEIAEHLPYMHIEDVFITGIIAGKILGARLESMIGHSYWKDETPDPCEFAKMERISKTNMNPALMYKTWQALMSPESICGNSTFRARIHRHNLHLKH